MRRLPLLLPAAVLTLALAGCELGGDKDKEAAKRACSPAPHALKGRPQLLPAAFPSPRGIGYTASRKQGPSTIVVAYLPLTIGPAHDAYTAGLPKAGYQVTHAEQDAADSEVNFAGMSTTGQVKMLQVCKSRTTVTITIRPS